MVFVNIARSASATGMTLLICLVVLHCAGCRTVIWSSERFHEAVPSGVECGTNLVEQVNGLLLYYDYDRWIRDQYSAHLYNTQGRKGGDSLVSHQAYNPMFYARYKNTIIVDIWSLGWPPFLDCGEFFLFATLVRNDDGSVDDWGVTKFVLLEKQTCQMSISRPVKVPRHFDIRKANVAVKNGSVVIKCKNDVVFSGSFLVFSGYRSFECAL